MNELHSEKIFIIFGLYILTISGSQGFTCYNTGTYYIQHQAVVSLDLAEGVVDVSLGVALLAVEVAPARVAVQRHGEEHAVLRSPAVGLVPPRPGGHSPLPVGVLGDIVAVRPGPVTCRRNNYNPYLL